MYSLSKKYSTGVNEYVLTKEDIKELKRQGSTAISELVQKNSGNNSNLIFILENLGHIPAVFNVDWLIPLLSYKNENVRFWAVKNLGKVNSDHYINLLYKIAIQDESTIIKREAVSSIGRMRNPKTIPLLKIILKDKDPKIVCQAIRGLLVFKGQEEVDVELKKMINHENEVVRTVIQKEYFAKKR